MISVAEAREIVRQHTAPYPPVTVTLDHAFHRILAEDVVSAFDSPPHDKSLMDGYAVRLADLPDGKGKLVVIEDVLAGQTPALPLGPGQATLIMTGAPIPVGADAVVPRERVSVHPDKSVEFIGPSLRPGANIFRKASELRAGEVVLRAGTVLRPVEIGVLATVGRATPLVFPTPGVAVLATGDELVSPEAVPGPGQIRDSNSPMLFARILGLGGNASFRGMSTDHREDLLGQVRTALSSHDILILSGGVSAGDRDLVPSVLTGLGVVTRFHKVDMKPGKPVLFGTFSRPSRPAGLVFGLPGNPVSSLACFELFVRPALCRLSSWPEPVPTRAVLAEDFAYPTDRPTFYPADLQPTPQGPTVRPVPWLGSADLRSLTRANALLELPPGESTHRAGQVFNVLDLC